MSVYRERGSEEFHLNIKYPYIDNVTQLTSKMADINSLSLFTHFQNDDKA